MLAYLHSAICPVFYAFNLKDFQAARRMFLNRKRLNDMSLSSKVSLSQINLPNLDHSFYSDVSDEDASHDDEIASQGDVQL